MANKDNTQRILEQAELVVWHETFADLVSSLQITRRALLTIGDLVIGTTIDPVRRMRIMAHIESALDATDGYDEAGEPPVGQ